MHMLHLHGFQRHDRLAGRDALALLDQNRDDAAVHRRANLAVAAGRRRGGRRRQREIADRKRDAPVQDIEPVAVAEEFADSARPSLRKRMLSRPSSSISNRCSRAIEACDIAAVALAHDFEFVDAMIELDADGNRKRRRQRPPAPPRRRKRVGDVKQQRRKRRLRSRILARRQQLVAMFADEGRRRFAGGERGMPQAGGEKRLVGGDAERDGLFEAANQLAPRLVAGGAMADDLGDHRIVERRNLGAGLQRVLDAESVRASATAPSGRTAA